MASENRYSNYVFDFERLEVYKEALEFTDKVMRIVRTLRSDLRFTLGGQLVRAAISIPNNIAEGSGKRSTKEKVMFYRYALNSARECVPMLTLLFRQQIIGGSEQSVLRGDCLKISNMLGKLIGSV